MRLFSLAAMLREQRVRQRASGEQWIRRALMSLVVFWLVCTVLLPMYMLFVRAMSAEVSVAIWGTDDVRIGGRTILLQGDAALIDGEIEVLAEGGRVRAEGFEAAVEDGEFTEVACSRVEYNGEPLSIPPVTVSFRGGDWIIDGAVLGPEDWQREVTRPIGFASFARYFQTPALAASFTNSLYVATVSTLVSVLLAFGYAYGLTRTCLPAKGLFRIVAMLPLFAPTMLYGLSLVYLFGNQGLITSGFFDAIPWLAFDIGLYGATGIILAEIVFTFPPAMLILSVALSNTDARLYEAAESLGASAWRIFWTVTLPGVRYGLLSAVFVCFTLAFTDFGAPKIVGGNYSVLAVEIYKQVVGQQDFGMGATVSIVLLVPALCAFTLQRVVERRQSALVTARSVPLRPKPNLAVDGFALVHCGLVSLFILAMILTAGYASLVAIWPYDLNLTLEHYRFEGVGGGGYSAFWNSIVAASLTALFGTALTFGSAYLVEKSKGMPLLRQSAYLLSVVPLALPGLVIGIAYIFFFNKPAFVLPLTGISLPNPFETLYGTIWIIVIANIVHFYTVSYLTAATALRQLDREFEAVSESMAAPFYATLFRVTVPLSLPAIFEILMFYFVNAMATVSAVIFLYTTDTRLASVAVVNMDDAGDTAPAAAMCMLIVAANIAVRALLELASYGVRRRSQRWRAGPS